VAGRKPRVIHTAIWVEVKIALALTIKVTKSHWQASGVWIGAAIGSHCRYFCYRDWIEQIWQYEKAKDGCNKQNLAKYISIDNHNCFHPPSYFRQLLERFASSVEVASGHAKRLM
jgi:hypothetical protein